MSSNDYLSKMHLNNFTFCDEEDRSKRSTVRPAENDNVSVKIEMMNPSSILGDLQNKILDEEKEEEEGSLITVENIEI